MAMNMNNYILNNLNNLNNMNNFNNIEKVMKESFFDVDIIPMNDK